MAFSKLGESSTLANETRRPDVEMYDSLIKYHTELSLIKESAGADSVPDKNT